MVATSDEHVEFGRNRHQCEAESFQAFRRHLAEQREAKPKGGVNGHDHFDDEPPDCPGAGIISASPYVWREPAKLEPRRWLYGTHRIRQFTSVTVAPGGLGKSSLVIAE